MITTSGFRMDMASTAFLKKPCPFLHRQSISMTLASNLSSMNHKVSPRLLPCILTAQARPLERSRSLPIPLTIGSSKFNLFSTHAFPYNGQNPGYASGPQNPNHGNSGQGAGYGDNQQSQQPWQQNNGPNPNYGSYRNPSTGNRHAQQQGFRSANNHQPQQKGFRSNNNQQAQQGNPRPSAAAEVIDKHLGPSTLKLEKKDGNTTPPSPPPRSRNFGSQGNQEKKSGKDLVAESAACAVIEKYLGPWPGFPPRDPKIDEYLDSLPENAACIAIDKYFGPYKPLFVFKKNEENANNPPPPSRPPRNRMMNRARNRPSQQDQQPWAGSQSGGYQGQGSNRMGAQQMRPPVEGSNPSNASLQNPQKTGSGHSPLQGSNSSYHDPQGTSSQGSNPASQGPSK